MTRQKRLRRPRIRVNVEQSAADVCRETARQFDPNTTDEEIVAGLRELADTIEREMNTARRAVG
jgi:hypothetical protein